MRNLYDAGVSVVDVYNVGCLPGESDRDVLELESTITGAVIREQRRPPMHVVVHTTPLRPMAFTPLFFAPISFSRNWRDLAGKKLKNDGPLVVSHSKYMEGTASHIRAVAVERCLDSLDARLLLDIVQSKKFGAMSGGDAIAALTTAQMHILTAELPFDNPFCRRWRSWQPNGTIYRRWCRSKRLTEKNENEQA